MNNVAQEYHQPQPQSLLRKLEIGVDEDTKIYCAIIDFTGIQFITVIESDVEHLYKFKDFGGVVHSVSKETIDKFIKDVYLSKPKFF